jgi:hypothetical protein
MSPSWSCLIFKQCMQNRIYDQSEIKIRHFITDYLQFIFLYVHCIRVHLIYLDLLSFKKQYKICRRVEFYINDSNVACRPASVQHPVCRDLGCAPFMAIYHQDIYIPGHIAIKLQVLLDLCPIYLGK